MVQEDNKDNLANMLTVAIFLNNRKTIIRNNIKFLEETKTQKTNII